MTTSRSDTALTRPSLRLGGAGVVAALLLLGFVQGTAYALTVALGVAVAALVLRATGRSGPLAWWSPDLRDLAAIAVLYLGVVAAFRVAFVGFTVDNVLGLFLSFAVVGLFLFGVAGPIAYMVWVRRRTMTSLGIGLHQWRPTVALGLLFAAVQFSLTMWGYDLPAPVDWVPLAVMSLTVGLFEAIFFRGFIQNRLEEAFGPLPGVAGAAALYSLYHIGYGMGGAEMLFLFGIGIVYALAFRSTRNILVLWPLLTPLGSLFNNLEAGDIELPWASIAGFADVLIAMAVVIWLGLRHVRRRERPPEEAEGESTIESESRQRLPVS